MKGTCIMRVKKACQCWAAALLLAISGAMGGHAAVLDGSYISIDVSGGPDATNYPLTYYQTLAEVPGGPNSDAYKTTNILLRLIPNGTFIMGSPEDEIGRTESFETQHPVTLTKDFFIGVFEVTQQQWELVVSNRPSWRGYYAGRPVDRVSYNVSVRRTTWGVFGRHGPGGGGGAGWQPGNRAERAFWIRR